MKSFKIISPAKINLTLDVLGKDHQQGKHFLNTFFYRLDDFYDEMTVRKTNDSFNELECDHPDVPTDTTNTILKALELLGERGWHIQLKKNIPIGGGLGGGSSNAGVLLKYFAEQKGIPLDHLEKLARSIGADVPFFMQDNNLAYAEGFGDQILQSWNIQKLEIEVINTQVHVSTQQAYQDLDLNSCGKNIMKTESLLQSIQNGAKVDREFLQPYIHNDFEDSFFKKNPAFVQQGNLCGSGGMMWKFRGL